MGSGDPSRALLNSGGLPAAWVARYQDLVAKLTPVWRDRPAWPFELVCAVHFASLYLHVRYEAWRNLHGGRNVQTEEHLAVVRRTGETFLMKAVVGRRGDPRPRAGGSRCPE